MSNDKPESEAQRSDCKNSGAASCYLLPCPFCGEMPTLHKSHFTYTVYHTCYAVQSSIGRGKKKDVITLWNTRAPIVKTEEAGDDYPFSQTMRLCPKCGNKRCPHATDEKYNCTNSNEPRQPGSAY